MTFTSSQNIAKVPMPFVRRIKGKNDWPYGGSIIPLSALKPKKGVVGGSDKMLFRGNIGLVKTESIFEAISKPVGDDKYEFKGKVGVWRHTDFGPMFFPDDGGEPTGMPDDAKQKKATLKAIDASMKLAKEKGNKNAIKALKGLKAAVKSGDKEEIAKASGEVSLQAKAIDAVTKDKKSKVEKKPSKKKKSKKKQPVDMEKTG